MNRQLFRFVAVMVALIGGYAYVAGHLAPQPTETSEAVCEVTDTVSGAQTAIFDGDVDEVYASVREFCPEDLDNLDAVMANIEVETP